MADKKISQLTALAQGDVVVSTDVLPIVDTSATETKKIAVNALVGAAAAAGLTNVDINSGTIDGTTIATSDITVGSGKTLNVSAGTLTLADNQISGDKVEGGTINAITINTLTSTAVNATTVDATNVEVTNIKAKDGTASIAIADSTGVASLSANPILSGGTANGVLYLNASKVATSGSALTYNGTNFGVGGAALEKFAVIGTNSSLNFNPDSSGTAVMYAYMNSAYNALRLDGLNQQFYVSGAEQMRLTSTGLGIGTSSPTHKLQTNGSGRFGTMTTGPGLLSGSSDTFQVGLNQDNTNTTNTQVWAEYVNGATSASWAVRYRVANDTGTASTRLFLDAAAGNLGIGTSSPDANFKVTVSGNSGAVSPGIYFDDQASSPKDYVLYTNGSKNFVLRNQTDTSDIWTATPTGNLGIGTSSPNTKLEIANSATGIPIARLSGFNGADNSPFSVIQFYNEDGSQQGPNIAASIKAITAANADGSGGQLTFSTSTGTGSEGAEAVERLRIDGSGNLGLGVTPTAESNYAVFDLKGRESAQASLIRFFTSDNTQTGAIQSDTSYGFLAAASGARPFVVFTNGTERARITSGGNLLLGTTTVAYSGTLLNIGSTSDSQNGVQIQTSTTGVGYLLFGDGSGADAYRGEINYSHTSDAMIFKTAATERARITSGGDMVVGSSTSQGRFLSSSGDNNKILSGFSTAASGYTDAIVVSEFRSYSPNNTAARFLYCGDNADVRAEIRSNGGLANYQGNDVNLSDQRVKTDIKPVGSYWDKFKAIEIVTFKYKDQTHDDDNIGVIAQQVESVAPEFIDVDGFGKTPEDGVPLKTVYTTDMYHAAIKALQEAMARIEKLEAEVAALKGA